MNGKAHVYTHGFDSPVGLLYVGVDKNGAVRAVSFERPIVARPDWIVEENKYACGEFEYQLEQYFSGSLRRFSLDVEISGTEFQKTVWKRLRKLNFGETVTYGEIARKIGRRDAARAVGNAVAANPVPIIVPCHRVIPANGKLGRYGARSLEKDRGTAIKSYLLALESGEPSTA